MDNRTRLADLARRLRSAADASDWSALAVIDRELAHLLRWLPRSDAPQERAALEDLQRAHMQARERCEREAARIDDVLLRMRTHRAGWMAYAMSETNEQDEARR